MDSSKNCLFARWLCQHRAQSLMYVYIHSGSARGASYPPNKNPNFLRCPNA